MSSSSRITRAVRDNVAALAEFTQAHDAYPKPDARRDQRALLGWLASQRALMDSGSLSARHVELYDRELPGWSVVHAVGPRRAVWLHRTATDVAVYFAQHGRFPSKTAVDPRARYLGVFLHQRRLEYRGHLKSARPQGEWVALLDRLTPGWDGTKSETWILNAQKYVKFVYAEGRHPRYTVAPSEERRMYDWHAKLVSALFGSRRGGAPWQADFMDQHLPGWRTKLLPGDAEPPASLHAVWRAPRLGDIVSAGGYPALAFGVDLNPAAPTTARVQGKTLTLVAVPHEVLQLRNAQSVAVAHRARLSERDGVDDPFEVVDTYLRTLAVAAEQNAH